MRKSPLSRTPDKSRQITRSRLIQSATSSRATSQLYYCHYKNATYMGGIKSFKKDGKGIMLHDSGQSILTSYYNDLMHGHNVFFDNYNLLSAIFNKNRLVEAVYRTQGFLAYLNYNQDQQLDGKVKLLNFITKSIIYATFRKGNIVQKTQQTDVNIITRIYELGQFEILIGRTHAKVLSYEFEKIHGIECQKHGNKMVIGFEKNGFLNGLGFQFIFRGTQGGYNPDTHRQEDDFELKVVQRGYYINTQLNGIGEKTFKNGNYYIGQFKNGVFEGNGILKSNQKKNWVSGYFKDGNLVELLQYSSEGTGKNVDRIVQALHQRKTNWINNEIHLINFNTFVDQIQKIISSVPNKQIQTLEQRKMEVLRRIQDKFLTQTTQNITSEEIQTSVFGLQQSVIAQNSKSKNSNGEHIRFRFKDQNQKMTQKQPQESSTFRKFKNNSEVNRSSFSQKKIHLNRTDGKRIQDPSPKWTKFNDSLLQSRKTDKMPPPSGEKEFRQVKLTRQPYNNSNQPLSSDRLSASSRSPLDSKRMVTKNKIFKYIETQDSKRSPQFNYIKADTFREMQRH